MCFYDEDRWALYLVVGDVGRVGRQCPFFDGTSRPDTPKRVFVDHRLLATSVMGINCESRLQKYAIGSEISVPGTRQ